MGGGGGGVRQDPGLPSSSKAAAGAAGPAQNPAHNAAAPHAALAILPTGTTTAVLPQYLLTAMSTAVAASSPLPACSSALASSGAAACVLRPAALLQAKWLRLWGAPGLEEALSTSTRACGLEKVAGTTLLLPGARGPGGRPRRTAAASGVLKLPLPPPRTVTVLGTNTSSGGSLSGPADTAALLSRRCRRRPCGVGSAHSSPSTSAAVQPATAVGFLHARRPPSPAVGMGPLHSSSAGRAMVP